MIKLHSLVTISARKFTLTLLLLSMAACQVAPEKQPGWSSGSGEVRPGPKTTKAVIALLAKARQASTRSHFSTAETYLERALQIEPRNPALWLYMAKLRLYVNKPNDALNLAKKALALSSTNPRSRERNRLQADCWRVAAHAYQQMSKLRKARQAQQKASDLLN